MAWGLLARAVPYLGRGASAGWNGVKSAGAWLGSLGSSSVSKRGAIAAAVVGGNAITIASGADHLTGHFFSSTLRDTSPDLAMNLLYAKLWANEAGGDMRSSVVEHNLGEYLTEEGHMDPDNEHHRHILDVMSHSAALDTQGAISALSKTGLNATDVQSITMAAFENNQDTPLPKMPGIIFNDLRELSNERRAEKKLDVDVGQDTQAVASASQAGTPLATAADLRARREKAAGQSPAALETAFSTAGDMANAAKDQMADVAETAKSGFSLSSIFNPITAFIVAVVGAIAGAVQRWALGDEAVETRLAKLDADIANGAVKRQTGRFDSQLGLDTVGSSPEHAPT